MNRADLGDYGNRLGYGASRRKYGGWRIMLVLAAAR